MKIFRLSVCFILCLLLSVSAFALEAAEEDFEGVSAGEDPNNLEVLYGFFEMNNGTPDSICDIMEENGNNVLRMTGYSELYSIDYLPAEYVFSLDIKPTNDSGSINIFVRGDMPGALVKVNPKNAGINQAFTYFEWDWYAENGGRKGSSSVGGSGVAIFLTKKGFTVRVKKYVDDSLTITSQQFNIKLDDGLDLERYNNVKVTDTGKEIRIYINGELGAYIVLSDDAVKYETDGTNIEYYRTATVFDASGSELGTVENTRLHYNGSQVAVAGRYEKLFIDNLKIAYGQNAIAYSNGEYVPDTDTEQSVTAPDTGPAVPDSETEEDAVTDGGQTAGGEDGKGGVSKKAKIGIIAALADAVIIAAMAVLIPKKKKQTEGK